jgi:hypothetical protein
MPARGVHHQRLAVLVPRRYVSMAKQYALPPATCDTHPNLADLQSLRNPLSVRITACFIPLQARV